MHPAPLFRIDDAAQIAEMIGASPFGMLAVSGDDGPCVAMLPMTLTADQAMLLGHIAVQNEIVKRLEQGPAAATVVFQISDAYVSPSFYPSKAEHGRAVPTWNYEAVEVRGEAELVDDPAKLRHIIEDLTDHMEGQRDARWHVSDAPDGYIDALSRGIRGIHLKIRSMTGVRKLSQNKSDADMSGVIAGLSAEARPASQTMAKDIQKLREA